MPVLKFNSLEGKRTTPPDARIIDLLPARPLTHATMVIALRQDVPTFGLSGALLGERSADRHAAA